MTRFLTTAALCLSLGTTPALAQGTQYSPYGTQTQAPSTDQVFGALIGALILGGVVHALTKEDDKDDRSTDRHGKPAPRPSSDRRYVPIPRPSPTHGAQVIPRRCLTQTGPDFGHISVAGAHCLRQARTSPPQSCALNYGPRRNARGFVTTCLQARGWRIGR